MRFVDEFRNPRLIRQAADEIRRLVEPGRQYRIMEVCGGHTHAIYRFALQDLLPDVIELIHGPGCPVCVLPMGRLDDALAVAREQNAILAAFGDVMRIPGRSGTPLEHRARGTDVRMVYSPLDALALAERNPDREVIFFAIGFETTAPSTALTLQRARALDVRNFSVFSNHVTIIPAIRAIVDAPDLRVQAFIGPGHVSTVIGCQPYEFVASEYDRPVVVSGFEPLDILQAIVLILRQMAAGTARVENAYARVVPWEGTAAAQRAMAEVFELRPFFEWRGLGSLAQSAYGIRDAYGFWDSERRFGMPGLQVADPSAARCGDVLRGALKPHQCPLFGRQCTPERPIGALMVSSEGACAAHARYVVRTGVPAEVPVDA
jgi:hydrogenase expression/formation protein HypD